MTIAAKNIKKIQKADEGESNPVNIASNINQTTKRLFSFAKSKKALVKLRPEETNYL